MIKGNPQWRVISLLGEPGWKDAEVPRAQGDVLVGGPPPTCLLMHRAQ